MSDELDELDAQVGIDLITIIRRPEDDAPDVQLDCDLFAAKGYLEYALMDVELQMEYLLNPAPEDDDE